ncbi:HAMP domain-containing sensor histidine kinase [Clostridium sp. BJN0001]|uniref:sensor histidine kinase n=1 Tax=Clostridium sp. BJN0001 TaxID=2930219 RepID=UPI001FD451ED|nr:HAMP domain-containing sensor histidine kinase [Clostridium sp. BJN0001]
MKLKNKSRRLSLIYKLILLFLINIGIVLICLAVFLSLYFKANYFTEKDLQFASVASHITDIIENYSEQELNYKYEELKSVIDVSSVSTNTDIFLYNKNDEIYVSSKKASEMRDSVKALKEKNLFKIKQGKSVRNIDKYYTLIYPIGSEDDYRGYLIMVAPLSVISDRLHKIYFIIWILSILAVFMACVTLSIFCTKIIISPLNQINNISKKFANGEVNERVKIKSNDEIGELALSFNMMAESLEKVDNNRRTFISNVSHELRSPITSIKGYIAGILDGIIPKEKEHYYLDIVYREIRRLTRLINDLLDLSAIESGRVKINKQKTDINMLLKECAVKAERKASNRGIKIVTCFNDNEKKFVSADKDKIIQVITNLIDNGIKYCDKNGIIKISTVSKSDKVFVNIYNNGPKIDENEIKHIWDRFYKMDKARTNKVSTGLGLSIVRMIILQHGEEVWVENDSKKGVTFIFTLTKYEKNKGE